MQIKPSSSVAQIPKTVPAHQELSNKQTEPPAQRLLAQVVKTDQEGLAQLKTLPAGQTLQLQTTGRLVPGQLVIVKL
ncbi:MAG: hypothetical protein ACJAYE_003383, partial [Candidatus Azotimanducaceae bacterium]